jgi:hypothetical protein
MTDVYLERRGRRQSRIALLRMARYISVCCGVPKNPTTNMDPATAKLLKRFDVMAERELAKWMLNCIERQIAVGRGKKMPRKYRPKFEL